ncbi:MAG: YdeI/OmpD-associated family protein [Saprospiraceae bacterium]|nr:YdeI/OmpD-associated family protein [Pyrinomonadaceae bacterium]
MEPIFFPSQAEFREWLEKNHETAPEVIVGYYKVKTGKPSMTWSESVDQALCFGWIDGVGRSLGEESHTVRFTPRRPKSIRSAINIAKVEKLTNEGLMKPAGIAAFAKRDENRSSIYSYENKPMELGPEFEKLFKADVKAWEFFNKQAPSYVRTCIFSIMTAKQEKTKLSRLEKLIAASRDGKRI